MIYIFCLLLFSLSFSIVSSQGNQVNLEAQTEALLNVEKQMRLAGDVAGTKKAVL